MSYWLFKSEPSTFSVEDLAASPRRRTHWDGVRNFQVRNFMRDRMKIGDRGFFYHSSCPQPGIVGIVEVVKEAYPDHTQFDPEDSHYDPDSEHSEPRWYMVDIALERQLERLISLTELKKFAGGALKNMPLLRRGNRLSITPVSEAEWNFILALERA